MRRLYESLISPEVRRSIYRLRHRQEYRQLRFQEYPSAKGTFSLRQFDVYRCIFVHIPKTAGTAVALSLFGQLPYHYTVRDYQAIFGAQDFRTFFKFAFVRNPWDRLNSAFTYLKRGGWDEKDRVWAEQNLATYDNVNDFVMDWLVPGNLPKMLHFMPQHRFVTDWAGRLRLDYVGYFESIAEDFARICEKTGIPASLREENTSGRKPDYREVYSDAARRRVGQIYAKDIQLFGYDFDRVGKRLVL